MPTSTATDGTELHHDDLGSGDVLMALAGGPARHPDYLGDLAGLTRSRRLVVPHLRGVGRSPAPRDAGRASWWRQAEDVEALRAHLGLRRLTLLGHSAGSRTAVAYAARFPGRVAALVLVTPSAGYLVDEPSDAALIAGRRAGDEAFAAAAALLTTTPDTTDDDAFTAWQRAAAPATYAAWGAQERAHAATGGWYVSAARAFLDAAAPDDLTARLRQVTAPVLVVAGAEDAMTGVAPLRALAALFPAGRLVTLERCGHYPWVEQPAAFRRAVETFLDDVDPDVGASG